MPFEVLPGLPPYGPRAINFSVHGEREHREGLVIRFCPERSEPWIGNFIGGATGCTAVLDHPNAADVIVVAQGDVCIVDPENRTVRDRIASNVEEVIQPAALQCVVFRNLVDFAGVTATGYWRSPRISWDGIRNTNVQGTKLSGEAYTPIGDAWVPFTLDLLTGRCADGIYENDIARAVPFVSSRPGKT
jgi:hypothetical protein